MAAVKTMENAMGGALTEMDRITTGSRANTQDCEPVAASWRAWFDFQVFGDPTLNQMLSAAVQVAKAIRDGGSPKWLVLFGTTNAGKTYLCKRLMDVAIAANQKLVESGRNSRGHVSAYNWASVADGFKEGNFGIVDQICEDGFALLDDIGTEYDPSGMAAQKLYRILDARQNRYTAITANCSLEDLARIDARLTGRILRDHAVYMSIDTQDYFLRTR